MDSNSWLPYTSQGGLWHHFRHCNPVCRLLLSSTIPSILHYLLYAIPICIISHALAMAKFTVLSDDQLCSLIYQEFIQKHPYRSLLMMVDASYRAWILLDAAIWSTYWPLAAELNWTRDRRLCFYSCFNILRRIAFFERSNYCHGYWMASPELESTCLSGKNTWCICLKTHTNLFFVDIISSYLL